MTSQISIYLWNVPMYLFCIIEAKLRTIEIFLCMKKKFQIKTNLPSFLSYLSQILTLWVSRYEVSFDTRGPSLLMPLSISFRSLRNTVWLIDLLEYQNHWEMASKFPSIEILLVLKLLVDSPQKINIDSEMDLLIREINLVVFVIIYL